MKELNKKNLDEAIRNLPDYEPKAGLWEQLQEGLHGEPVSALQSAIEQLPEYSPSDALWERIDGELDGNTKVVQFNKPMWLGIAASLLLLIAVLWNLPSSSTSTSVAVVAYSTEKVDNALLIKDWDADEDVFIMLKEVCDVQKLACNNPEVKVLQSELAELNDARYMLKEAIGNYGTDVDLIQELTDIELQRTSLAKEILEIIA